MNYSDFGPYPLANYFDSALFKFDQKEPGKLNILHVSCMIVNIYHTVCLQCQ